MLIITVQVNAPVGQAIGIKEQIAVDLENTEIPGCSLSKSARSTGRWRLEAAADAQQ